LPKHRLVTGLSREDVDAFTNALIGLAEPVDVHFLWRPQLRDPADEMVLETAANGRAAALVTFNQRDYGRAPASFGIEVLLPREALRRINT
jgi:predicted nucleic acid-binding protein